ncbi:DinB family protein [Flavobacterium litorale]|uniref:DinB family protein n=1 Tax=Flavobacterium litorale TaxID=2856519 RepID=A0ABX8V9X5_9FLAO|nr:DinB family protein [Flavobacterium litorale]QYJ67993.1 DinB family protein [Flavobacterium litorale]
MDLIHLLNEELQRESVVTRKMLAQIPEEHFEWQPHPKSMKMKILASHIAELPDWIVTTIQTDELDFAVTQYEPKIVASTGELLDFFEEKLAEGKKALAEADINTFNDVWVLRKGDEIYTRDTKYEVLRMCLAQIIHHRAQLGVYFRLLDMPVPATYGPSADDMSF